MALPWLWTRRLVRLLAAAGGVWMVAAATVPYWSPLISEGKWYEPACWWLHRALDVELETMMAWLNLSEGEGDALVAVVGFHIAAINKTVARCIAPIVVTVFYLFLCTRVRVDITRDFVSVRRWWGTQRIKRTGKLLAFRMVDPVEYFDKRYLPDQPAVNFPPTKLPQQPLPDNPPTIVEVLVGKQRYWLFTTRHADVAEAIVFACQAAFTKTEVDGGRALPPSAEELCMM